MKRNLLSAVIFASLSAGVLRMSDADGSASPSTDPAPVTKESLLDRVEALFAKGVAGVEAILHDAISAVEEMFATDDGESVTIGLSDTGNVPSELTEDAGNASTSAATDAPASPAAPVVADAGNVATPAAGSDAAPVTGDTPPTA